MNQPLNIEFNRLKIQIYQLSQGKENKNENEKQETKGPTHDHIRCVHMQISNQVVQLAGNFSRQFHGLSADYSNFPWHTCMSIQPE